MLIFLMLCLSGGAEACAEVSPLLLCGVCELSVRGSEARQEPGTALSVCVCVLNCVCVCVTV